MSSTHFPPPPPRRKLGVGFVRDPDETERFRVYAQTVGETPSKKYHFDDLDEARAHRDKIIAKDPKFTTCWIVSTKTWEIMV